MGRSGIFTSLFIPDPILADDRNSQAGLGFNPFFPEKALLYFQEVPCCFLRLGL